MTSAAAPGPERGVFVNRTLNLRSIRAIGYDMDYTLIHYRPAEWESRAFEHAKEHLAARGWPVERLIFDPSAVIRGLAIDLALGNLVKATRFGYVIRASHGTKFLDFEDVREMYRETLVDLAEPRFVFINVLFGLSEASLFAQLVDLLDEGLIPHGVDYADLYVAVVDALEGAHVEGALKQEIVADPERFVVSDPDTALALADQFEAGKRLMLITNSEWEYTDKMMSFAIDPHLRGRIWRDLFDTIIVSAQKPDFFTTNNPLYKVIDEDAALLRPHRGPIEPGSVFFGGCARQVEESLDLTGDEILYVGDHLFGDVHFSKALLRWRTALVLREMETEVQAAMEFKPKENRLIELMDLKRSAESRLAALRLSQLRSERGHASPTHTGDVSAEVAALRAQIASLDEELAPLARAAGEVRNRAWGPLMRAGIDKSLFARQVERYADVYTSRVSNFATRGPYAKLRARRVDLPHDLPDDFPA